MKKSLYRQVVFLILVICLVLLIAIAYKSRAFPSITELDWISAIINNSYFSGVFCSVISVVLIYYFQIQYSKKMIKKDFRCNEIIFDLVEAIKMQRDLNKKYHLILNSGVEADNTKSLKEKGLIYYNFYRDNKTAIQQVQFSLTYNNNEILIESVQSCFFNNLNFKLLNIINNIKNRLFDIRKKYPDIVELCDKYEKTSDDNLLISIGDRIPFFLIDLDYMALYWYELLDYLKVDVHYFWLFCDFVENNLEMPELHELILLPKEEQKSIFKLIKRKLKVLHLKNKIKHFRED